MAPGAPQHQQGTDDDPRQVTSQRSHRNEWGASASAAVATPVPAGEFDRRIQNRTGVTIERGLEPVDDARRSDGRS